jgi:hypothetical protein
MLDEGRGGATLGNLHSITQERQRYHEFLQSRIPKGDRPDLTGGAYCGAWVVGLGSRQGERMSERVKGNERTLGDTEFVNKVLQGFQGFQGVWASRGSDPMPLT